MKRRNIIIDDIVERVKKKGRAKECMLITLLITVYGLLGVDWA